MNEDAMNMSIRKFLKKVGVSSQREIEIAIRDAIAAGHLAGTESLKATMVLKVENIGLEITIDGDLALE